MTVAPAGLAQGYLKGQSRWHPLEIAFWLATLLPYVLFPDYLSLASQIAITALFALSLDLILGYAGIVSLGHAAFFGIGAYAAGNLSKTFTFDFFGTAVTWPGIGDPVPGLFFAALMAGLAGYGTSFIIARFRHFTLIMITLGLGFIAEVIANRAHWLTGGSDSLQGIHIDNVLGLFRFDLYGYTAYTYSLVVLFILFLCVRRLVNSPFGLALRGIRENWVRMPAIGAASQAHVRLAYTIAATIAGVAGALLTQTTQTAALGSIDFGRSADVVVMLVLGGAGRLYGGLVGAVIYMVARDQFSGIAPQYWFFWIGLMLVCVVMFLPNGILGGLSALYRRWRSK
jgi:branched-chain amino acid transport system permease protein